MKSKLFKSVLAILMTVFAFSCEKSKDPSGVELTNYQSFGGHRYAITSDRFNWDEAEQFALEQGGYLVIIDSSEENSFIRDTYRIPLNVENGDILWIGLSDVAVEGTFRWVNGEIPAFTNWSMGEPNNDYGTQNYGHMYLDGTWDDVEVKECYAVIEFDN